MPHQRTTDAAAFHDVGRLFPTDVEVVTIDSGTSVSAALEIMLAKRYSQLPVVDKFGLRGVFSLRSLARQIATTPDLNPSALQVEDVMERLPTVSVEDSFHGVIEQLLEHEALLVGSHRELQAVLTMEDALKYFYRIARAFVLLGEIELALRSVISACAPDAVPALIEAALSHKYKDSRRALPTTLDQLSLEDYKTIIAKRANWHLFEPVFGRNRDFVILKLERIRILRNNVFHFRSEPSVLDHQDLVATRDWLLDKISVRAPSLDQ